VLNAAGLFCGRVSVLEKHSKRNGLEYQGLVLGRSMHRRLVGELFQREHITCCYYFCLWWHVRCLSKPYAMLRDMQAWAASQLPAGAASVGQKTDVMITAGGPSVLRMLLPCPNLMLQRCTVLCCSSRLVAADRACGELSKLVSLRELNLSQNRALSDGGLRQLARGLGDNLFSINLSYTSVTDESVATLAGMKVRVKGVGFVLSGWPVFWLGGCTCGLVRRLGLQCVGRHCRAFGLCMDKP
jgi:hypothetical protein